MSYTVPIIYTALCKHSVREGGNQYKNTLQCVGFHQHTHILRETINLMCLMRETKRLKEQNWTVAGGEDDERKMAVRWLGHPDTRHRDSLRCFSSTSNTVSKTKSTLSFFDLPATSNSRDYLYLWQSYEMMPALKTECGFTLKLKGWPKCTAKWEMGVREQCILLDPFQ